MAARLIDCLAIASIPKRYDMEPIAWGYLERIPKFGGFNLVLEKCHLLAKEFKPRKNFSGFLIASTLPNGHGL